MAIEDRNLAPGTRLTGSYRKKEYACEVVEVETGEGGKAIRYRLEDGSEFKSPSSAASSVMGGKSVNGWRFWSLAGQEKTGKVVKQEAPAQKPSGAKDATASPKAEKDAVKAQGTKAEPKPAAASKEAAKK